MGNVDQIRPRFGSHALRRRIIRRELGMLCFEFYEGSVELVVLEVADDWIVEDVVTVVVVLNLAYEFGVFLGEGCLTHGDFASNHAAFGDAS